MFDLSLFRDRSLFHGKGRKLDLEWPGLDISLYGTHHRSTPLLRNSPFARARERKERQMVHSSEIGTSSSMNLTNLTLISVVSSPLSTSETKKTST